MATLTDPVILGMFQAVLANWAYRDFITAKQTAEEWGGKNLPGFNLIALGKLMHDHVQAGGVIDQVPERRPEWNHYPFHYDFRLTWAGRAIYVETILLDDDPKDPTIHVVSIHDV